MFLQNADDIFQNSVSFYLSLISTSVLYISAYVPNTQGLIGDQLRKINW